MYQPSPLSMYPPYPQQPQSTDYFSQLQQPTFSTQPTYPPPQQQVWNPSYQTQPQQPWNSRNQTGFL